MYEPRKNICIKTLLHSLTMMHEPSIHPIDTVFFMCINWKLPNWFIFDILEWNQSVCDCNVNHKENNKCCFCFKRKKSAITFQAIKKNHHNVFEDQGDTLNLTPKYAWRLYGTRFCVLYCFKLHSKFLTDILQFYEHVYRVCISK